MRVDKPTYTTPNGSRRSPKYHVFFTDHLDTRRRGLEV